MGGVYERGEMMKWTQFMDMHSGGGLKEPYTHIYIEAPADEAIVIFYNRFGHNPNRVTCTCCGEDYSITESESLEQATAFARGCAYGKGGYTEKPDEEWGKTYTPLNEYLPRENTLVIRADEIKPAERKGDVPEQGYIWTD